MPIGVAPFTGKIALDIFATCSEYNRMAKSIQLRHVPNSLHRRLKTLASLAEMSLSEYLVREVRRIAERPTLDEIKLRLRAVGPSQLKTSPVAIVREERDRR
jgi:hypothetical protein